MPLDDALCDHEAEPGAARIRPRPVAAAEELGEELALLLRGHAQPGVVHHDLDRPVRRPRADAHAPGPRVLERVRDEVPEDLDEPVPVAHDRRQGGQVLLESESAPVRLDPEGGGHVAENGHEVDELPAELHPARLDLGHVQEIVDQGAQPVRALGGDLEEALLEVGHRPRLALEDELDVASERGQRGAKLVRDRGDELVLHPLHRLPVGHVAHHHHERAAAVGSHGADRQLGGKPRPIRPHALDLDSRRRARRGGAGELETREDDHDGPPEQRGRRLAEHRLRRGVRRRDQAAPVGRHDPVLRGVDDPPQLTGHARQIVGAKRRGIPAAGQRRRQSTVPDGDGRQAGEPTQAVPVDRAGGAPPGPDDHELARDFLLDHHRQADLPRVRGARVGGIATRFRGAPLGSGARDDARDSEGRVVHGHVHEVGARDLPRGRGDARQGRPDVAGRREGARGRRQRLQVAVRAGEVLGLVGWRRSHPQTPLMRCSGLAAPFGPTRSRRASTARRRALATTR